MAKSPEKNQKPAAENPEAAKKKVARKRVAKNPERAVTSAPNEQSAAKQDAVPKKKVARKRVAKKSETTADMGDVALSSDAPHEPSIEQLQAEAPASRPGKGEVRRESGTQNPEYQEEGDKKRRRRRRRRGGDSRDEENSGEQGGDSRSNDEQPEGHDDDKDGRPMSQRVKVRQPESQRQHDRRPTRYTENPELIAKYAWQLYKGEIREEGGTLIDDRDAKKIAERAFRMAEIFLMEQARMG